MKSRRRKSVEKGQIDIYARRTDYGHKRGFYHAVYRNFSRLGVSLGCLRGDARIAPGQPGGCHIELSEEGLLIDKCISDWAARCSLVQKICHVIMPDHVHMLIQVRSGLKYHFSNYTIGLQIQMD